MNKSRQEPEESKVKKRRSRPATTPEGRENQMIALAMDLAEKRLRDGTASNQLIVEFVKRGATKTLLEKEIMEEQKEMLKAKTEQLKMAKNIEELYSKALKAMQSYSGSGETVDEEDL